MSLTTLTVSTHNPTKYTLHDHETGDVWRGTNEGHWKRQAARVDESAIERLRNALKMFDEHRTTMQSLASSVGDFLRESALSAQPASDPTDPGYDVEVLREQGQPPRPLNEGLTKGIRPTQQIVPPRPAPPPPPPRATRSACDRLSWAQGIGHEGGHYDQPAITSSVSPQMGDARACMPTLAQPAKGLAGEVVAMRDAVGVCRDGIQARIAELEAAQPAEQGEAVAFCRVEDVDNNDSHLAQLGVKRGDKLYLRPAAPMGVPDESIEENGKWYVLMDGARYEVSRIEADGWDYCVSYLQKLNAATSPAPQGEAIGVIVDADLLRKNQPVTAYPLSHPGAASMTKLYLHSAAPVGGPDGTCSRCNGTGEYMDYRGNMSQMETCYVCDGSGKAAAPSAPQGEG